jgi:ParB/RepB/Spo0J family partition protein
MTDLTSAVAKTMNFVFADIETATNEVKKRINSLKANIGKVANIPLDDIETSENVRKSIDTESESFLRLVESIKKYGVLENVVVELRLNKKETDYKLVCIAGHRRILAARATKTITKVPCLLQSYAQKGDNVGAALAENLNREDLHCLDVAEGYRDLVNASWNEDELAKHYCRDIRTIRHYLKMADWPAEVKNLLRENPKMFSTRVIMRQFAYRKFATPMDLKNSIQGYISPKQKPASKRARSVLTESSEVSNNKKAIRSALKTYLAKQKLLSSVIKEEIERAFVELKLI